jgi:NAD(P)-dependent dehydrogenase (short-subunit alcohol dehydrogenase family)
MPNMKKTILITGSSSGFGKLAVEDLLKRGHTVIAALRGGETRLREIFSAEISAHPDRLFALDLHMERPETFSKAWEMIDHRFGGKLDVLINNAGYGLFGAIEDQSPSQLREQFEVNFFGPVLLARTLLPALRRARGRIINLSSIAGRHAFPLYGSYNATKFALEGVTEAMFYELKPHGVQVCLVEPGGFKTSFISRSKVFAEGAWNPASPYRSRSEGMKNFFEVAGDRLGDPRRVSRLVARLCERTRIPLRAPIGPDAWLMIWLGRLFPTRLKLWLVDFAFSKLVFRGL